jgi:glycosyltransferase involved in cell wall biosynthesis
MMKKDRVAVSIVINNFNYERFLRESIDSALSQTYPDCEVIVVDDGSTDASACVMRSYGNQIKSIFQENQGQGAAMNAGFEASIGDWVLFLDADDTLLPIAAQRVVNSATKDSSHIQYYLSVVDENSRPTGVYLPTRPLQGGDLRTTLARFRYYNSPPSSGNAYARRFLLSVLPMPSEEWRISADAFLIFAAPFEGTTISVNEPLGCYRRHGGGASDGVSGGLVSLAQYVKKELGKEAHRERYVRSLLVKYKYSDQMLSYMSPTYCKYMLVDSELDRAAAGLRNRIAIAQQVFVCATHWPNYQVHHRVIFTAWCATVMLLPRRAMIIFVCYTLLPHWRKRIGLNALWQGRRSNTQNTTR